MTEDMEVMENENVILVDEEGVEHEFALLDVIESDGNEYVILEPAEEDEEPEAIILKITKDENGEELLVDIEDDDEWEKIADLGRKLWKTKNSLPLSGNRKRARRRSERAFLVLSRPPGRRRIFTLSHKHFMV